MNLRYLLLFLFSITFLKGQFTIVNTLKTADEAGLKMGNDAYLTAAKGIDANGDGYLRLTDAVPYKKGYMYVKSTFPTTMGITADFEYKAWRNVADTVNFGADGFTFFLFDGAITEEKFLLGGWGGSLGYATFSSPANTPGLSGGYIGIGFDAFGNYIRSVENRNGGQTDYLPNSIVLRGPTTATYSQSNIYLASKALGNRSGTLSDIRKRNEIDYNTTTATRPNDNVFYRRVQVSIIKSGTDYIINVKWRKEGEINFTEIINYTMSGTLYPLPKTLKIGFAGSTGGGFNTQEIRNILITTPGNIRVDSRSNTAIGCNDKNNEIVYRIEVTNDTNSDLTAINFSNKIINHLNNVVPNSQFKIKSIITTGFTSSTIPSNSATNEISGKVGLQANKSGIVTITGEYLKNVGKGKLSFSSISEISSNEITDIDSTNNVARTNVTLLRCGLISNPILPSYSK